MAYLRKQPNRRVVSYAVDDWRDNDSIASSLATKAIRASSAHRDTSFSSAYGETLQSLPYRGFDCERSSSLEALPSNECTLKSSTEHKNGFWSILASKAKMILEDDNVAQNIRMATKAKPQMVEESDGSQIYMQQKKNENPPLQKGFEAIASSLSHIGTHIGSVLEEGLNVMETRTADIISETRKLHIRRKGTDANIREEPSNIILQHPTGMQTSHETQLKASRDVAMAMAAKTKLLLRELKTTKADLTFAKQRCTHLEEENKILRQSRKEGDTSEDDDLIRLQLETLLAEKARLAHENSMYARENRFLREVVEYHQLTMQDVVYVDEDMEEVSQVSPLTIPTFEAIDVDLPAYIDSFPAVTPAGEIVSLSLNGMPVTETSSSPTVLNSPTNILSIPRKEETENQQS